MLGVTVTTMLIGLLISAAIGNPDQGMQLLVLMVMVQLIFCGGLFPVHDRPGLEQLAWFAPARWAFAQAAATTDLVHSVPDPPTPSGATAPPSGGPRARS